MAHTSAPVRSRGISAGQLLSVAAIMTTSDLATFRAVVQVIKWDQVVNAHAVFMVRGH